MIASKGSFFVLGAALCWSTMGCVQSLFSAFGASPVVTGFVRMGVGGLALAGWCALRGRLPRRDGWPLLNLLICVAALVAYQVFFFQGTIMAGVAVGTTVAIGAAPIFAAVISAIVFHEKPVRAWYPATALAILGIGLINWTGGEVNVATLVLPLLAALCYGINLNGWKTLTKRHHPDTVMMVIFLCCAVVMLPMLAFEERVSWLLTPRGWFFLAYMGIVTAALPFVLMLEGLRSTAPSTAGTLGLAEPMGATFLGLVFLAEPLSAQAAAGVACILASALLLVLLPDLRWRH